MCGTCGGFGTTDGGRTGQIRVCEKNHSPCSARSPRKFPNDRVSETPGSTRVLPLTGARKV